MSDKSSLSFAFCFRNLVIRSLNSSISINNFRVHLTMKNNLRIIIPALLLLLTGSAFAKEDKIEVDLLIGASLPVLYHCGIGFHYVPNARLDINLGSDFNNDNNGRLYELTFNHAAYFGNIDPKVHSKLWSVNSGFSFLVEQSTIEKSTAAYLNIFFAHELPVTKKLFVQPEFGASYFLFEHVVDEAENISSRTRTRIIPKLGINLILKI